MPQYLQRFHLHERNMVVNLGAGNYFLVVNSNDVPVLRIDEDGTWWIAAEEVTSAIDDTAMQPEYV